MSSEGVPSFAIQNDKVFETDHEDCHINTFLINENLLVVMMLHSILFIDSDLNQTKQLLYQSRDKGIKLASCIEDGFGNDLRFIVCFSIDPKLQDFVSDNQYQGSNRKGLTNFIKAGKMDVAKLDFAWENE